jgi:DNA helicase-2/ATP-dependent DNA helicase PcrA
MRGRRRIVDARLSARTTARRLLMRFHVDLHVHSKYSRATSRDLDLEHLAYWAGRKGIGVVATGDFTHPAWRAEIKEKLVPAEPGLFRLRPDLEAAVTQQLPPACQTVPRFMLSVEISTIYKKGDRTRKIHHLLYAPDFDTADRISASLGRIGNINSDGRPILGLDSRHLLEITLDSHPDAYLIPAHIWTPWFAVLGSQSGFDSIVECYGDLSDQIFAVETGLSSDPPMNWRLSMLDRYRLVSNSDAHSPGKLGREATTLDTALDYFAIRDAFRTGAGYVGTVEFFPEEGKYHLDGHRKCGVRLTPEETRAHGTRCPACGQAMTIGVATRAASLSDRGEGAAPPATAGEVSNLVPLVEVLGEIAECGPASKQVARSYDRLVSTLGSELFILASAPLEDVARAESTLLAEALSRLRAGTVIRDAGYDGEYGVIRLFEPGEMKRLSTGGSVLFDTRVPTPQPAPAPPRQQAATPPAVAPVATKAPEATLLWNVDAAEPVEPTAAPQMAPPMRRSGILAGLDADQRRAAEVVDGPLLIIAGPGSGKTRTLTHRLAHLIGECGAPADACLAITFTRRAAAEMRERLAHLLPGIADRLAIHTFHSLGLTILREHAGAVGLADGFRIASEAERTQALADALGVPTRKAETLMRAISKARRTQTTTPRAAAANTSGTTSANDAVSSSNSSSSSGSSSAEIVEASRAYQRALSTRNWVDFDDLVSLPVRALSADAALADAYRQRFRWLSVDEFQDVDEQQYRLLTLLAAPDANLCVIGDPNQAIYGFRGADASCFDRFARDYPRAVAIPLSRNYRSSGTIVTASSQLLSASGADAALAGIVREMHERITIQTTPTDRAEAEFVIQTIEQLIGGHSFFSIDSGRAEPRPSGATDTAALSFSDFAVLFRTDAQSAALLEAFERSGLPFKKHAHEPLAAQPAVSALLRALPQGPPPSQGSDPILENVTLPGELGELRELGELTTQAAAPPLAAQLQTAAAQVEQTDLTIDAPARHLALQRLLALAASCGDDRARFMDALALATEADFWDPRADRVSLLTLHAAKGLEFSIVFIVGLEDGLLPLYWNDLDETAAAEERRLLYVGMTRAKDRLFLSRAAQRLWRGRVQSLNASRFLSDIESELTKHQRTPPARRRPDDLQLRLL